MTIEIEHRDGVCILRLKGRFVAGTDPEYVLAKLKEIKSGAPGMVLVDLREVSSIGSMGLGFLVGLYISITKDSEGRFVLVGANSRVREVLSLTRLNTVIPHAADFVSGLAVLRRADPWAHSAKQKP